VQQKVEIGRWQDSSVYWLYLHAQLKPTHIVVSVWSRILLR